MNELKLQLIVARWLPDKIHIEERGGFHKTLDEALSSPPAKTVFLWKKAGLVRDWPEIPEESWLYIIGMVEEKLNDSCFGYENEFSECDNYAEELLKVVATHKENFHWGSECIADFFLIANSTFNQRATAMCKIKGVEP